MFADPRTFPLSLLLLLTLLLAGCQGNPVYETRNLYSSPQDAQGRQCARSCETQRKACDQDCRVEFNRCADEAHLEARDRLPDLLDLYAAELKAYRAESELYERDERDYRREKRRLDDAYERANQRCEAGEARACERRSRIKSEKSDLWQDYKGYKGRLSEQPEKPEKPSAEQEADRLVQKHCERRCDCERGFELCFTGCGGQVRTERFCVENCEEK